LVLPRRLLRAINAGDRLQRAFSGVLPLTEGVGELIGLQLECNCPTGKVRAAGPLAPALLPVSPAPAP
jgi:hypothetical protein